MVNKFYFPENLPICSVKDELIELIKNHQVLIVAGETGSGKTTQLPKLCLVADCVGPKKVIACTQPRRIAASSVAKRVSEELGEEGQELVGYRVRFVDKTKRSTKIKFLTDGLLLAEAAADPYLRSYDVIIVDEAHERSLNIDFLLGLLKKLIKKRPELKLIISSATLDTEKFSRFFSNAKVASIPGKTFPIEVRYAPPECDGKTEISIVDETISAIRDVLVSSRSGDILVFMPTERDINEIVETINSGSRSSFLPGTHNQPDFEALPLFGRMSVKAQAAIFNQSKKRKIIIATNVAETSITVPGIRFVIDTGLARIASYSPKMRATKLPVQPISSSSADQRKGRCGRIGPGVCIRLYSEENYLNRPKYTLPEIMRSNLAEVILRMTNLRLGHPSKFPFIDPPKSRSIKDGITVLHELGAIYDNSKNIQLTKHGKIMARLPLDPCLARIVLEAKERNVLNQIIIIVAVLSLQDPRIRPLGEEQKADSAHKQFTDPGSDFITYLNIWRAFHHVAGKVKSQSMLRKYCLQNFLVYQRMREWMDIYEQICRGLEHKTQFSILSTPENHDSIHQSLLSGLIRNIAFKKEKKLYTAAYGKEVMIFPGSGQFANPPQWLLAAELVETNRLYARTIGAIDPKWLEKIAGNLCKRSYSDPHWEKRKGQVVAYEKTTLFGLVINESRKVSYSAIDRNVCREIFIQSALVEGQTTQRIDFLDKNRATIQRLQDIEDKVRTRHVIDEYTIFTFYDSRIPHHIVSMASLIKALPVISSSLIMSESDVCTDDYDLRHDDKFPTTLTCEKFEFQLSYKFEPGSIEDGVTVLIPSSTLLHINPLPFEWLVPGLLSERVLALLKSLPKSVRKHLVPVNKTTEFLISQLEFGKGSLQGQLSALIAKNYQVTIERQMWQPDLLPNHLKMRFCLVNDKAKVLEHTRNFNDLFKCNYEPSGTPSLTTLKVNWEKEVIDLFDDWAIKRIPVDSSNGLSGYLFPGLVDRGDGRVGVKLFLQAEEQIKSHRLGLLVLYKTALAKQVKLCEKELKFQQDDWALVNWLGGFKDVNRQMLDFILLELFCDDQRLDRDQNEFNQKVIKLREDGFFSTAAFVFKKVREILAVRRKVYDILSKYAALSQSNIVAARQFADFFVELERILPHDFLQRYSMPEAEQACRYLEALKIIAERAYVSPVNHTKKASLIVRFSEELAALLKILDSIHVPARKTVVSAMIDEFKILIEEYKISVFAPEMKT
nr:ATP-dependent RNA helicase HrpA [Desulfobulbaceae bacterium]